MCYYQYVLALSYFSIVCLIASMTFVQHDICLVHVDPKGTELPARSQSPSAPLRSFQHVF